MNLIVHMMSFAPAERQMIINALDQIEFVKNWRVATNAFFIVTPDTISSHDVAKELEAKAPSLSRFVVAKIASSGTQGRADNETWDFLNNPRAIRNH